MFFAYINSAVRMLIALFFVYMSYKLIDAIIRFLDRH